MNDARKIGVECATSISREHYQEASALLLPILDSKTPFRLLDVIGVQLGKAPIDSLLDFLKMTAGNRKMGGWVVIASALRQHLDKNLHMALGLSREYAIFADVWYAADALAERVPGPALVDHFHQSISLLESWRQDANRWIRRMVGVAVHYWAKQAEGHTCYSEKVDWLLTLLAPMFSERDTDVVKGVGWGLKTLGKYYPDILGEWLNQQKKTPHRSLMLRKAITYLPDEWKHRIHQK